MVKLSGSSSSAKFTSPKHIIFFNVTQAIDDNIVANHLPLQGAGRIPINAGMLKQRDEVKRRRGRGLTDLGCIFFPNSQDDRWHGMSIILDWVGFRACFSLIVGSVLGYRRDPESR